MIRHLVTPETVRAVLSILRDEQLRFHFENLDDGDENDVKGYGKETKEEKDNVRMIVQEIREPFFPRFCVHIWFENTETVRLRKKDSRNERINGNCAVWENVTRGQVNGFEW
jgi:hypothetical protein